MYDKEFDYWLLIRFIDGKANEAEKEQVLAWINSVDANKELYFRVKDILDHQRAAHISTGDVKARWQQVQRALQPERPARSINRRWMKYAAALLIVISATVYFFYRSNSPVQVVVSLLPTDTTRMIRLPDSSQVWLGPGSELRYYQQMAKEGRQVWMKGTGYFEIRRSAQAHEEWERFTVHTQRMDVVVLGTSFVVREDNRRSSVVVNTGAVKAKALQQEVALRSGERWLLENGRTRKEQVNASLYTAWKDDDPLFEKATLVEMVEMLNIIYGYDVKIEKPEQLKGQHFSGRISIKDGPELLKALSIMYNVTIRKEGKQIIIQPK